MLRAARDHGAGDQAARDHDVARAALDDAARDDAALDHDLRAGRDAGHHLLELYTLQGSAGSIVRAAAQRAIARYTWILMVRKSSRYYLECASFSMRMTRLGRRKTLLEQSGGVSRSR